MLGYISTSQTGSVVSRAIVFIGPSDKSIKGQPQVVDIITQSLAASIINNSQ